MNGDVLAAIRARAEAATEGPWVASVTPDRRWVRVHVPPDDGVAIARCVDDDVAEFIAAARSDVPLLVAEVEQLRGQLQAVLDLHQLCVSPFPYGGQECGECCVPWPCSTVAAVEGAGS